MKLPMQVVLPGSFVIALLIALIAWTAQDVSLTICPVAVPLDAPALINPLRGLYRWRGQEVVPSPDPLPAPALDSYDRYIWRNLEPSRDQYDFSVIDRDLAAAAQAGRKHAFRIRTLVSGNGMSVPNYLADMMKQGWWYDYSHSGADDTYVPDWNAPDFMDRAGHLIAALGARYNHDPRVGWVEIGMYGNWGEWHMANFPYPSPAGAQDMTAENRRAIVDMYRAAFPDKHLVMLTDDKETLAYALRASPTIGWRRDSLGTDHFEQLSQNTQLWALIKDRWKTAPVVSEFINPEQQRAPQSYLRASEQVQRYHISLVGNGNLPDWDRLDEVSREALIQMAKTSGYRIAPSRITVPIMLWPGMGFSISSTWVNTGVAPPYEIWHLAYQLREPDTGQMIWDGASSFDVRRLLRTGQDTPSSHIDSFTLPPKIASGIYDLVLIVRDPEASRRPMSLAIQGRRQDGSYLLGSVVVTP